MNLAEIIDQLPPPPAPAPAPGPAPVAVQPPAALEPERLAAVVDLLPPPPENIKPRQPTLDRLAAAGWRGVRSIGDIGLAVPALGEQAYAWAGLDGPTPFTDALANRARARADDVRVNEATYTQPGMLGRALESAVESAPAVALTLPLGGTGALIRPGLRSAALALPGAALSAGQQLGQDAADGRYSEGTMLGRALLQGALEAGGEALPIAGRFGGEVTFLRRILERADAQGVGAAVRRQLAEIPPEALAQGVQEAITGGAQSVANDATSADAVTAGQMLSNAGNQALEGGLAGILLSLGIQTPAAARQVLGATPADPEVPRVEAPPPATPPAGPVPGGAPAPAGAVPAPAGTPVAPQPAPVAAPAPVAPEATRGTAPLEAPRTGPAAAAPVAAPAPAPPERAAAPAASAAGSPPIAPEVADVRPAPAPPTPQPAAAPQPGVDAGRERLPGAAPAPAPSGALDGGPAGPAADPTQPAPAPPAAVGSAPGAPPIVPDSPVNTRRNHIDAIRVAPADAAALQALPAEEQARLRESADVLATAAKPGSALFKKAAAVREALVAPPAPPAPPAGQFRAAAPGVRDVSPAPMGMIGQQRGDLVRSGQEFVGFFDTLARGNARLTALPTQGLVRIDLAAGPHFYLRPVESIPVPQAEIDRARAAGEIPASGDVVARGVAMDFDGTKLIQMARGAGRNTAWHEVLHVARGLGLIPARQWEALSRRFAAGKSGVDAEEAIARAIETPGQLPTGFVGQLRRLMTRFGAWLRNKGLQVQIPGEVNEGDLAREDVQSGRVLLNEAQDAETTTVGKPPQPAPNRPGGSDANPSPRDVGEDGSRLVGRSSPESLPQDGGQGKGQSDGTRFKLDSGPIERTPTGDEDPRVDLANPGGDAEGRQFVRNVRASMDAAGEPGTRSWEQVEREANQRDTEATRGDIRKKVEAGEFLSDTEVVIARRMIADDAGAALRGDDPALRKRTIALVAGFSRVGTATARALAIRRDPLQTPAQRLRETLVTAIYDLPRKGQMTLNKLRTQQQDKASNPDEVKRLQQRIDRILEQHEAQVGRILAHLRRIGIEPSEVDGMKPAKAEAAIREAAAVKGDIWDTVYEFWINSILSGPQTHTANIAGNAFNGLLIYGAEKPLRAAINGLIPGGGGKAETFDELRHLYAGAGPGLARAGRAFLDAWRSERPRLQEEVEGGSMLGANQGEGRMPAIAGRKGRIIRTPTRFMLAVDEFFKSLVAQMEVGAQAYRAGRARGMQGEELEQYIRAETAMLGSQAWQDAMTQAREVAFQGDNALADAVTKARGSVPGARYVLPFVVTPLNIFARGLRMSPLGAVNIAQRIVRDGLAKRSPTAAGALPYTRAEAIQHAVEFAAGMGMLAALAAAVGGDDDEPWITGTEPASGSGQRELKQRTAPPFSIKIGDRWFSYARIEPLSTSLATVVDIAKQIRTGGLNADTGTKAMAAITEQVQNKTFLKTLGDIVEIATNAEAQGSDKLADVVRNTATGFVPNVIRQSVGTQDDTINEKRAFAQPWTSAWWGEQGRLMVNDAIGGVRFTPKVDLWGREIRKGDLGESLSADATDTLLRLTSPTQFRDSRDADEATMRWDIAMRAWNARGDGAPMAPAQPRTFLEDRQTRTRWYFTPQQYAAMLKDRGLQIQRGLDEAATSMRRAGHTLLADPHNPTARDMAVLRRVVSRAHIKAMRPYREQAKSQGVSETAGD